MFQFEHVCPELQEESLRVHDSSFHAKLLNVFGRCKCAGWKVDQSEEEKKFLHC